MIRQLVALLFLAVFAVGGVITYRNATENRRALEAATQLAEARQEAIARLTRSRRVAEAVVVDRYVDEKGCTISKVRFVELDENGEPLKDVVVEVEGEVVYFDSLVLKFDGEKVAAGDPLKGRSVILFRRLFGEHQKPIDGVPLDAADEGGVPLAYSSREGVNEAERALWSRFWELANDPEAAAREGVRVAQGEAPYTRMETGKIYRLSVDDAGGLNVGATAIPAVLLPGRN
jgi:hypothetical protein